MIGKGVTSLLNICTLFTRYLHMINGEQTPTQQRGREHQTENPHILVLFHPWA